MKKYIGLVYLFGLVILCNATIWGCDCLEEKRDLPKLIKERDVMIFSGKVIQQFPKGYLNKTIVKFQVYDAWKNVATSEQRIIAKPDSNACGYDFMTGKTYFVIAYRAGDNYETSLCTPTTDLIRAKKMMQELDKITPRKRFITNPKP